jgi:hypothetical protein
MNRIQQI